MNENNLNEIFQKENLIIPDYKNLNIVDLMQTLFSRYGKTFNNKKIEKLNKLIPNKKHTLFILIDGMGTNLINSLNNNSILKTNMKDEIITVCPTSTGCVLTTIATAEYPSIHGILGWYSYNRNYNIDYYPLLFCDRKNNKDLSNYNIKPNEIYISESHFNTLNVKTNILFPNYIVNSEYSKFVANDNIRIGYKNIEDAFSKILDITKSDVETFTYLYIPNIDNLEHDNGVYSNEVKKEIDNIETNLKKLKKVKNLVTIVTADHGQTNIYEDIIMDFNKYDKYFYAYPSIDFGTASYYVKEEYKEEFEQEFIKDYKDKMYLFKSDEFIEKNFFGLGESNNIKNSLGEYISVCKSKYCFINSNNIDEYYGMTKGNHSGFSKDELSIPLIIIEN